MFSVGFLYLLSHSIIEFDLKQIAIIEALYMSLRSLRVQIILMKKEPREIAKHR